MSNDNFETMISELDNAIHQLESGELSLDDSIKIYTEAVAITKKCFKQLDEAKAAGREK